MGLPGVGPQVAAAVLALLPPELWGRAKAAASYAGLIPEREESGKSVERSRLSRKGPPLLRRKLYMGALVAVRHDPEMRAFYHRLLSRGKKKKQALVAVAHKLLHAEDLEEIFEGPGRGFRHAPEALEEGLVGLPRAGDEAVALVVGELGLPSPLVTGVDEAQAVGALPVVEDEETGGKPPLHQVPGGGLPVPAALSGSLLHPHGHHGNLVLEVEAAEEFAHDLPGKEDFSPLRGEVS